MEETFGDFIKRRRLEHRLTLRGFSTAVGMDPANYSKLERGLLAPPKQLARFERALGLAPDSPESRELRRLADLGRGKIPSGVLNDRELVRKLPALFRTLEGDPVDDTLLADLIETIRRE
jgi:transcriptional regulator with XRE-family HTH domain